MNCGEQGRERSHRRQINGGNDNTFRRKRSVHKKKNIKGKSGWKGNELDGGHVESGSNVERQ